MASKKQEQRSARFMYVEQGKTAKEIAASLNVSEKTLGTWVADGKWKAARTARLTSLTQRAEDVKLVLNNITEERLALDKERREAREAEDKERMAELDKRAVELADEIAKWNKTLSSLTDKNKISLEVYLDVMEQVFNALQAADPKLYMHTLDFQEKHIHFVTTSLG